MLQRSLRLGKRALPAATAAGMSVAAWVGLATAGQAAGPSLSDNPTSGPPGTAFTVTGTGFCPTAAGGCSAVVIQFNGTVIRRDVQVDGAGSFHVGLAAGGSSGAVLILATQNNDAVQARTYFTVTPGVPLSQGSTSPPPTASPGAATPVGPVLSTPAAGGSATPGVASAKPVAGVGSGNTRGGGTPALVIGIIAAAVAAVALAVFGARRVLTRPGAGGEGSGT